MPDRRRKDEIVAFRRDSYVVDLSTKNQVNCGIAVIVALSCVSFQGQAPQHRGCIRCSTFQAPLITYFPALKFPRARPRFFEISSHLASSQADRNSRTRVPLPKFFSSLRVLEALSLLVAISGHLEKDRPRHYLVRPTGSSPIEDDISLA